jgi:hypothetical protein
MLGDAVFCATGTGLAVVSIAVVAVAAALLTELPGTSVVIVATDVAIAPPAEQSVFSQHFWMPATSTHSSPKGQFVLPSPQHWFPAGAQ